MESTNAPSRNIVVRKSDSKKARLQQYLERTRPAMINATEWNEITRELAPVSDSYLRDLLRGCGVPLHPLIQGVRQDSFENLERTLGQLLNQYESGDAATKRRCRDLIGCEANALVDDLPEQAVVGPGQELDFDDKLWPYPMHPREDER